MREKDTLRLTRRAGRVWLHADLVGVGTSTLEAVGLRFEKMVIGEESMPAGASMMMFFKLGAFFASSLARSAISRLAIRTDASESWST